MSKFKRIWPLMLAFALLVVSADPRSVSAASPITLQRMAIADSTQVEPAATPVAADDFSLYLPLVTNGEATTSSSAITLNGDSIAASVAGVVVFGSTATITTGGIYQISGILNNGQIVVDSGDEDVVTLILNGVAIANSSSAAINVINAKDVYLVLAEGSTNTIADGATYVYADPAEDEPNAAIFSKVDLTISGSGSLSVQGNYNDGIAGKDELVIAGGAISVKAVDDGIRGKDSVLVQAGTVTISAGGDGLKSDDEEDVAKGYITIENGALTIVAGGDAIQAQTSVTINGGQFTLTSGGGSSALVAADASAKGIKAGTDLTLGGGTFVVNAADDAIHAGGNVLINDGSYTLASGDDGVHADTSIIVSGGNVSITRSYEGLESNLITINDGDIRLISSDDGINIPGAGDNGGTGQAVGAYWLYVNGGYVAINAGGDGLDANGAIAMAGGVVIVHGPTNSANAAVDYDGMFTMSGGVLAAAGSAGMAQAPSTSSTQNSLLITFNSTLAAGTLVHIQDSAGNALLTFAPAKSYQSLAFSSPQLTTGATYKVYVGGSAGGPAIDGVYSGAYTPGQQYTSFTVTSTVTKIGGGTRP